jgi:hypothetical protein
MKEVDPNNVALFQFGKLVAFGTVIQYDEEEDGKFKSNVVINKGQLLAGQIQMQICREYDVIKDNCGLSAN